MNSLRINPTILFLSFFIFLSAYNVTNAQCISGDCENGFGKYKTEDRIFYSFFENGIPTRFAVEKFMEFTIAYQILDGKKHGVEVKYNTNGHFVINQFEAGLKNGYMITGNFRKLTGSAFLYENDKKIETLHTDYDKGVTSSKGNALCKGDCKNGLGLRRMDDTYYFGVFHKRKASPIGVDQWDNSPEIYLGGSHDFVRKPFGMYRYESGNIYIGEYSRYMDGIGMWISKEGVLTASIWKKGKEKEVLYTEQLTDLKL